MPVNGIIGDDNFGTELPTTTIPEAEVEEMNQMAKYAKSPEFKRIKSFFEDRIMYYQSFLPDGRDVRTLPPDDAREMWPISNAIIGELKYILNTYDASVEAVKNVRR